MQERTYTCDQCGKESITLAGSHGITFENMEEYAMSAGWGGWADGSERLICGRCMTRYIHEHAANETAKSGQAGTHMTAEPYVDGG